MIPLLINQLSCCPTRSVTREGKDDYHDKTTACILAAPGSVRLLTKTHSGLLPTCRLGFDREGLEVPSPLTLWTTTTNFIGSLLLPMPRIYLGAMIEVFCGFLIYDSNSERGIPDCLIMDWSVPILISLWSGTGTVLVPSDSFFCITIWLPLLLTSLKPCCARIMQTSLPERTRSLLNSDLNLCYKYIAMQPLLYLLRRGGFKE